MNNDNTITKEQVKAVVDTLKECETEEDKIVRELPSNNGVEETNSNMKPVTEKEMVTTNPLTGLSSVMNGREKSDIEENEELKISEELQKLLDVDEDEVFSVPESIENIKINDDLIKDNALDNGANPEDITAITQVISKYRATIDKDSVFWYDILPKSIQNMIQKECAMVNNYSKKALNTFATEFLETIIRDSKVDSIIIDMQKSIAEAYDMSPLMETALNSQKTIFEDKLSKNIELLESKYTDDLDEEAKDKLLKKIETLKGIRSSYIESYTYTDMLDKIKKGKIRIKKFDIRKYKRYCEDFLYKYRGDTPFIIHNVNSATTILLRKFENKYTSDRIIGFIIAFIKYTNMKNMSANDVVDHTFMSYFISNIINLDMIKVTENQESFSSILLSNIDECISSINIK